MRPSHEIVEALGWSLLHFLWQGTAVALLLWVVLLGTRKCAAHIRYAAAGVAFLVMLWSLAGTLVALWPAAPVVVLDRPHETYRPNVSYETLTAPPILETPISLTPPAMAPAVPALPEPEAAPLRERIRPVLPWCVGLWAVGVLVFSLRFLYAWNAVRKWRASGNPVLTDGWPERFASLCARLNVSRPVKLLTSTAVAVPVVIGWLKPMILLPAGLLTGLSIAQLEAVLAHELAHVRRHDYLVNLLQNVVETLCFYHPAVWWVSRQLRKEREHCCDDIAASLTGGPLDYARALATLEEMRGSLNLGLSAATGPLLQRIRRLIGLPEEQSRLWPLGLLAVIALALAVPWALAKDEGLKPPMDANALESKAKQDDQIHICTASGSFRLTEDIYLHVQEYPAGTTKDSIVTGLSINLSSKSGKFSAKQLPIYQIFNSRAGPMLLWKEGLAEVWAVDNTQMQKHTIDPSGQITAGPVGLWDEWGKQADMPQEMYRVLVEERKRQDINPPPLKQSRRQLSYPVIDQLAPESDRVKLTPNGGLELNSKSITEDEFNKYLASITNDHSRGIVIIPAPDISFEKFCSISNQLFTLKRKVAVLLGGPVPPEKAKEAPKNAPLTQREWSATGNYLNDPKYLPVIASNEKLPEILWTTPDKQGMSLGISGIVSGSELKLSSTLRLRLWLKNTGTEATKFSWSPCFDDGVQVWLTDKDGKRYKAHIKKNDHDIIPTHTQLGIGAVLEVKSLVITLNASTSTNHDHPSDSPIEISAPPGEYEFQVRHHVLGTRILDEKYPQPFTIEWTEDLTTNPVGLQISAAEPALHGNSLSLGTLTDPEKTGLIPAEQQSKISIDSPPAISKPENSYLKAYLLREEGLKLAEAHNFTAAMEKLKVAQSGFTEVQQKFPDWQPEIVAYRVKRTAEEWAKALRDSANEAPSEKVDQSGAKAGKIEMRLEGWRKALEELKSEKAALEAQSVDQLDKAAVDAHNASLKLVNRKIDLFEQTIEASTAEGRAKLKLASEILGRELLAKARTTALTPDTCKAVVYVDDAGKISYSATDDYTAPRSPSEIKTLPKLLLGEGLIKSKSVLRVRTALGAGEDVLGSLLVSFNEAGFQQINIATISPLEFRFVGEASNTTESLPGPKGKLGAPKHQNLNVERAAVLDFKDVKSATAKPREGDSSHWEIAIELTENGANKMAKVSQENRGKALAVVANGVVLMAPTIMSEMGAQITISGNFTEAEAKRIADGINRSKEEGRPAPQEENSRKESGTSPSKDPSIPPDRLSAPANALPKPQHQTTRDNTSKGYNDASNQTLEVTLRLASGRVVKFDANPEEILSLQIQRELQKQAPIGPPPKISSYQITRKGGVTPFQDATFPDSAIKRQIKAAEQTVKAIEKADMKPVMPPR